MNVRAEMEPLKSEENPVHPELVIKYAPPYAVWVSLFSLHWATKRRLIKANFSSPPLFFFPFSCSPSVRSDKAETGVKKR